MNLINDLKSLMSPMAALTAMNNTRPEPKIKPSLATVKQPRRWQDRNKYVVNGAQFPPHSKKRLRKEADFVIPASSMAFEKGENKNED